MNLTPQHAPRLTGRTRLAITGATALLVFTALGARPARAGIYEQAPMPGGVRARAQITAIKPQGSNLSVCWYGLQGWYTLETAPFGATNFTPVGSALASDFAWCLTVPKPGASGAQFRLNQGNGYVGPGGCAGCHGSINDQWRTTVHATAYNRLVSLTPSERERCLVCHTTGYGQPTGFTSSTNTLLLANVGCESCHGPAAAHKYGDHGLVRPAATLSATICGGCHNGAHHPTYDEWTRSGHAVVTEDVAEGSSGILSTNAASGYSRQMNCGPCHSGATRLAMIQNYNDMLAGQTNYLTLPGATEAADTAVTCVVCHDPHFHATNTVQQLRYPLFSTNFYTFFTASPTTNIYRTNYAGVITTNTYYLNTAFAAQHNPRISICAQCHNSRGALWQGTSRPPHHSPQYNLLIGSVQTNYLNGTNITWITAHGRNTDACARCHVPVVPPPANIADTTPVSSGHTFDSLLSGCTGAGCHSSTNSARNFLRATQLDTTNQIAAVVGLLNRWATNKGPVLFTTNYANYRANSWEFTTPGALASLTNAGPSAADQAKIPNTIKQARFNLYLVFHDGSLGAHNGAYSRFLLDTARTNVLYQLSLP